MFLMTSALTVLPVVLMFAQGPPGDPGEDPDPAVPFDGGLTLLVAAGIGYAAKKGYDRRKRMMAQQAEEKNQ